MPDYPFVFPFAACAVFKPTPKDPHARGQALVLCCRGLPAGVAVWGSPGGFLQLKGTNMKKRLMSHVPTEFHKGAAKFRGAVLFELSWRIVGAGC